MSDMKCPFCQQEMICGGTICHYNPDCPIHDNPVPTEVLELLERTRKALELAIMGLKNCKTRDHIGAVCRTPEYVDKILEQITATLENQNGNC